MYKRRRSEQDKKMRSISVVEFLAENEHHTMEDVKKEFGISRETARRDIKYLYMLIIDGKFSQNPAYEKKITRLYLKAQKTLHKHA